MGKNIILKALISFQNKKKINVFDSQFDEFLKKYKFYVLGKIRNENFKDILFEYESNGKYTEKKLKNSNININIKIQPIKNISIKEQLQPIKSNVNQLLNNNESNKNKEYSNMLYRELDPKNKNHNRPLRKLYCEKKLSEEGKKIKSGIFKQNTKNYIECKDRTTITAKNMLNKGISPFNNINNENISVIKKSCKSNNSNISELKNTCVINFFKEKQSAMGGSKKK